jgi:hypothetical protein
LIRALFLFSRCGISYYSGADKLRASMGGIRFARGRAETSALGVVDVLGRVPTSLCHSSISLVIAIHPSTYRSPLKKLVFTATDYNYLQSIIDALRK